ncbi:MAG: hypothetical protein EA425_00375 [Puniceicoccaceae bacterium]|nr:MAG: hypothetical protein EA425_00375 [Puniceicoccaceae bacterium]
MKPLPSTVAVRRRLACLCAGASLALATPAFSSESVVLDDFADLALSPAWVVGPSLVTDASAGHLVVRGTGGVSNLHLPLPFGRITRGTVTLELDFFLPVTSGRHVVGFGLVDSPGGSGWAAVGGADRYIMTDQVDPVDPELTFPPQILAKAGQWTDNLLPTGPAGGAQQGVWHYIRIEYDLDAGEHRFYTRLRDDAGEPTLVATNPLGQSALEFFVIGAARATAVEQPDSAGARFDNIRAAINREAEGFTRIPHAEPGAWVRTPGLFGGAPPRRTHLHR